VAINSDPDAPIFSIATYGIVGKVEEVLPALIREIRGSSS
jgi:electron transfer flavoprotein alpha subunit